ncbi:hypothetical protein ACOMHN_032137 [Nucella lapillus]
MFQSSLTTGSVPLEWRDALVTPIFKKGEQYNPINYRPVSLTCVICKLMEHIIVSALMNHLEENYILRDEQHGFRKKKSCETQLLEFIEELTENLESGRQTDILIMDFAKPFYKVNHSLLLHKLSKAAQRFLPRHEHEDGRPVALTTAWLSNYIPAHEPLPPDRVKSTLLADRFLPAFPAVQGWLRIWRACVGVAVRLQLTSSASVESPCCCRCASGPRAAGRVATVALHSSSWIRCYVEDMWGARDGA